MLKPNAAPLPEATHDLEQARRDLDLHGYCLIADALSPEALAAARQRLIEQAQAENEQGLAFRDGGRGQNLTDPNGELDPTAFTAAAGGINQRLWMLVNKGQCFRDMVVHPLVDALVGHVLGEQFILSTLSANIAKAGGRRMGLHTDQWWMPQPARPGETRVKPADLSRTADDGFIEPDPTLGIAPAVVCNTMWMLSDFTLENGATEVVPGSHLTGAHPPPHGQARFPIVQTTGPAGTLMVFEGRLWHGTGENTGGGDRLGVLATFCAPQFRQQENQTLGLDRALWPGMPDNLKRRLGFRPWHAYGRVESPAEPMVEPEPRRIGELMPKD